MGGADQPSISSLKLGNADVCELLKRACREMSGDIYKFIIVCSIRRAG